MRKLSFDNPKRFVPIVLLAAVAALWLTSWATGTVEWTPMRSLTLVLTLFPVFLLLLANRAAPREEKR